MTYFDWSDRAREWQQVGIEKERRHRDSGEKVFVCEACTGAGKSKFAGYVASDWLHCDLCDHVIVLAPRSTIKAGLIETFSKDFGRQITRRFFTSSGREYLNAPPDTDATITTWQEVSDLSSVRMIQDWMLNEGWRFGLIIDEIHHAGSSLPWGDMMQQLMDLSERAMVLSGTMFRTDRVKISGLKHTEDHYVCTHHQYRYKQAAYEKVCRHVAVRYIGGSVKIGTADAMYRKDIDKLTKKELQHAKKDIFKEDSDHIQDMIRQVSDQVTTWRASDKFPKAKALFVARGGTTASGTKHVRAIASQIHKLTGEQAVVVTHKDRDAVGVIENFKESKDRFIVAVDMISEGVDIPKLRAVAFCRPVNSKMQFFQIAGRALRMVPDEDDGTAAAIYLPKIQPMIGFAEDLYSQSQEALTIDQAGLCILCGNPRDQCICPCIYCGEERPACRCERCLVCKRRCIHCICDKKPELYVLGVDSCDDGGYINNDSVGEMYIKTADVLIDRHSQHSHCERVQLAHALEAGVSIQQQGLLVVEQNDQIERTRLQRKINKIVQKMAGAFYEGNYRHAWNSEAKKWSSQKLDRMRTEDMEELLEWLELRFQELIKERARRDGNGN